jgi:peptide chain release factor
MKKHIIQITSGKGPVECHWVVAQVLKILLKEAKEYGLGHHLIDREAGTENGTIISATIQLQGDKISAFLENWIGTIQWIGQSRFRKLHKRKNWYVGVNNLESDEDLKEISDKDIRYEFTRSGGPGGQHVNKVSTAVRATHLPTGQVVFVSQGRSQLQNKKEAKRKLLKQLEEKATQETKERVKDAWENHAQLDRGNPIRVFKGSDFKPNHQLKKYKSNRQRQKQDMLRGLND